MKTNKYQQVSIDLPTYDIIKKLANEHDRTIKATIKSIVNTRQVVDMKDLYEEIKETADHLTVLLEKVAYM